MARLGMSRHGITGGIECRAPDKRLLILVRWLSKVPPAEVVGRAKFKSLRQHPQR